jgi:hypothetical protein
VESYVREKAASPACTPGYLPLLSREMEELRGRLAGFAAVRGVWCDVVWCGAVRTVDYLGYVLFMYVVEFGRGGKGVIHSEGIN